MYEVGGDRVVIGVQDRQDDVRKTVSRKAITKSRSTKLVKPTGLIKQS